MANNLWSCDDWHDKIYKHSGGTYLISTSFSSPAPQPRALTWDGSNLWSTDPLLDKIYKHSGGTSSISTSFTSPSTFADGLAWIAGNLWSCDANSERIYKHSGGTSGIISYFSSPASSPTGLCYDGTNLWSCDAWQDKIYKHSGLTSGISTYFTSPSTRIRGLAWDGTNLWSVDSDAYRFYKHYLGTSSILTSFSSLTSVPGGNPVGICWEGASITVPTVSTYAGSSIGETTLYGNGYINSIGGATVTQRGFCYMMGSSGDPTTANSKVYDNGSYGTGSFNDYISGLTQYSYYRVRAYAINSAGTGYGTTVTIRTLSRYATVTTQAATSVDTDSALGNGNVTDVGDSNITTRGFCYKVGTSGDPTTSDSKVYDTGTYGTGAFSKTISSLSDDTGYRVRAYAINARGTSYGTTVQVTTSAGTTTPTVTTSACDDVEDTTATGCGNVTATGGLAVTTRGFCYMVGTSGDPTTSNSKAYDSGSYGVAYFEKGLTGLSKGTSYRVRAYAINANGTSYGTTVQILTKPSYPTSVTATDATHTDKVVIEWVKATGATGYQVYRDGIALGWLGDVATYDDEDADPSTITPGSATASDGTDAGKVALSITGQSVADGATHTYKVKARNATGESDDSSTNTGRRGHGALTYQWQRSEADSDADYSNIDGATTESYDDTGGPS